MTPFERLQHEQAEREAAVKDLKGTLAEIVDENSFVEKDAFLSGVGLLDGAPIWGEGVLCGSASLGGKPIVVIAQNVKALYGSFGAAQAQKIVKALDFAMANDLPVISLLDSCGARVGEGVDVLEGYGAVLQKAHEYDQTATAPHFAIVKGQAVGLMAVYAGICDYCVALPRAVVSVTAPAVLAAEGTQTVDALVGANASAQAGVVDFVCDTVAKARDLVQDLLAWSYDEWGSADDPNRECEALAQQFDAESLLEALCDDGRYIEYQTMQKGTVRCALTGVNGKAIGVAVCSAQALLSAADANKLCEFARLLAKQSAPLVTLVDSDGFADVNQAALQDALVNLTSFLTDVDVKIAVVCGHAVGSAYTVLASKGMGFNYSLAFAGALISPVTPKAAIHLLYADQLRQAGNTPEAQAELRQLYSEQHCDAFAAAKAGYVDEVIHPATLRPYIANALLLLA